jgi:hypothetical protein
MIFPAVLESAAMGSLIHECGATQHKSVVDFWRLYRKADWYLAPEPDSGVPLIAGTVPVDPFCFTFKEARCAQAGMSKQLHFDLSLSNCVVEDGPAHRHIAATLEGRQHCSLISASGAGKTKAVMDFLKVLLAIEAVRVMLSLYLHSLSLSFQVRPS